jgi:hypothetical protein
VTPTTAQRVAAGGDGRAVRIMLKRSCARCNVEFQFPASQDRRGRGKFCSRSCYIADLAARRPAVERFWEKITRPTDDDQCWAWIGGTNEGYGVIWVNGRTVGAHVFSYELHVGSVPAGLWVLHTCDSPPCANPRHLYAGTPAQNSRDRDQRGRANTPSGDRNGAYTKPECVLRGEQKVQARLRQSDVEEIRRLLSEGALTTMEIAQRFAISSTVIRSIKAGRSWRACREGGA